VLGLDELADDEVAEHSDEPFHLGRAERALLPALAGHVRDPSCVVQQS